MKYVITGGAGNISRPLAEKLLQQGHQVTVVGRNAANLQPLVEKGAQTAIGKLEDDEFLSATFHGADAVYTMIPPDFSVTHWRQHQNTVAGSYTKAIVHSGVKNIVVLSSIGAHLGNGAGPIDGLADYEQMLSEIPGINVKVLRPAYFYTNFLSMIGMIKQAGIMGANFGADDHPLPLVHPVDIAMVAAEELHALDFTGQTIRYIAGDAKTGREIADILGNAIGKPGLPWIIFTDEQSFGGMKSAGLPDTIAEGYTQLGQAVRSGLLQENYLQNLPELSPVKLEDFAKEFAIAYNNAG